MSEKSAYAATNRLVETDSPLTKIVESRTAVLPVGSGILRGTIQSSNRYPHAALPPLTQPKLKTGSHAMVRRFCLVLCGDPDFGPKAPIAPLPVDTSIACLMSRTPPFEDHTLITPKSHLRDIRYDIM